MAFIHWTRDKIEEVDTDVWAHNIYDPVIVISIYYKTLFEVLS